MSIRLVNSWIMLLISLAACLILSLALTYQGWTASSNVAPVTANCAEGNVCGNPFSGNADPMAANCAGESICGGPGILA